MGQPAAKQNDQVVATDTHIVMSGSVPTLLRLPFVGIIDGQLSRDVNIEGMPAATVDSTATNTPAHIPQGGPFQASPSNKATIKKGSRTVFINGKAAARSGDMAETCNDLTDLPIGNVVSKTASVFIGG